MKCPCGSNLEYSQCCEPVIKGTQNAATPEALMRARYSAYAQVETDFLIESIAPKERKTAGREEMEKWARESKWLGLEIIDAPVPADDASEGKVEFIARYADASGNVYEHHELSDFQKIGGKWYFYDGKLVKNKPFIAPEKIERNAPCPCGSGKKYKKCCGR